MIKKTLKKNALLIIMSGVFITILIYQEHRHREDIARTLLLQASIDNIYTSNLFYTIENSKKISTLFHSIALQDIMSYGNQKDRPYQFVDLDYIQQLRLCRGYKQLVDEKYLELYEKKQKNALGSRQSLISGLKELNKICTSDNVKEFKKK